MYFVYALYNADNNKMYVGQTLDLINRVYEHNHHLHSRSYTSHFSGEWRLFYQEAFSSREEALKREKQLKNWHRQWKINLIESKNKEWKDLYSEISVPLKLIYQ